MPHGCPPDTFPKTFMSMIDIHHDQVIDMVSIVRFTGMTDKWIYKLTQKEEFPKPIKLGRSYRWLESEITEWVNDKVMSSRNKEHKD